MIVGAMMRMKTIPRRSSLEYVSNLARAMKRRERSAKVYSRNSKILRNPLGSSKHLMIV
jgi:hypothetical protein